MGTHCDRAPGESVFSLWHIPTSAVLCEGASRYDVVSSVHQVISGGVSACELMVEEASADRTHVRQLIGEQILEALPEADGHDTRPDF